MYYVVTGTLRPLEPLGCLHRFSHELKVRLPVPTMLQWFVFYCFKRSIIGATHYTTALAALGASHRPVFSHHTTPRRTR